MEVDSEGVDDSTGIERWAGSVSEWSPVNWAVVGGLFVLTVVGIALSTGAVDGVVAVDEGGSGSSAVSVPLFVYLYPGFGALGYIFTKLTVQLDQYARWGNLEDLVSMVMRIPAAWVLATGIYLFVGEFGGVSGTTGVEFSAGLAFLVGLYVNVSV